MPPLTSQTKKQRVEQRDAGCMPGCFGGGGARGGGPAGGAAGGKPRPSAKGKGVVSGSVAVRMVRAMSSMFDFRNPAAEKAARMQDAGVAENPAAAAMRAAAAQH